MTYNPHVYDYNGREVNIYDHNGVKLLGSGGNIGPPAPVVPVTPISPYATNQYPNHLKGWWSLLQSALAGTARANVLFATNSLYGYYANGVATIDYPTFETRGHVGLDRSTMATRNGARGVGVLGFSDPTWSTTGSPGNDTQYGLGMKAYNLSAGQTVDNSGVQFDTVTFSRAVTTLPDTAAPTYYIDGVLVGTGSTGTALDQDVTDTYTVALDVHTLSIHGPASGTAKVSPPKVTIGSTTTGVSMQRNGSPGGYTYNFLAAATGATATAATARRLKYSLDVPAVDLLVLAFGHNEWRSGQNLTPKITPTDLYNYTMFILDYQIGTRGKWAALPIGPGGSPPAGLVYSEQAYWDVYQQIAQANDHVDCFDYRSIVGPYIGDGIHPSGTWVDGIHQNADGHALMNLVDNASIFPDDAALAKRISNAA